MKKIFLIFAWIFCLYVPSSAFAFDSGSTGADGAFSPTTSQAIALPQDGVFNFTTVDIPSGVTIKFSKNADNTPVTILATGDVTIAGTIDVSGTAGSSTGSNSGKGGPGGYDGGEGGRPWWNGAKGQRGEGREGGGGGAAVSTSPNGNGAGGGCQDRGQDANYNVKGGSYCGNTVHNTLIGGSGGGGGGCFTYSGVNGAGGGGGGGAILIASNTLINITGAIKADGGTGGRGNNGTTIYDPSYGSNQYMAGAGGGSGGTIRLVAPTIQGNGTISANGSAGGAAHPSNPTSYNPPRNGGSGGYGYIRLESNNNQRTANTSPWYQGVPLPASLYPTNMPSLAITEMGGIAVPSAVKGDANTPDVTMPYGVQNPVSVKISAANLPLGTTVTVKVYPAFDGTSTGNTHTSTALSGPVEASTATASINLYTTQPSLIYIYANYTPIAKNGEGPLYAEGELVKEVRVSAELGRSGTKVVYVTETGREVPANL